MKKYIAFFLALIMAFAVSVPVMAIPSYDSTVLVDITPDDAEIILSGDSVDVTYSVNVTNISKSGDLPQIVVTPFGDNTTGLATSAVTKIVNKNTVIFEFTVTYTEIGEYEFWVNIKNMQGNSGKWNYEFTSDPVTTVIIAPPASLPDGFSISGDGLAITKNALKIGEFSSNGKDIIATIDGILYDVNSEIGVSNNGIVIKEKVLKPGMYVITNTASGLSFRFEIEKLDGYQSIIKILS